jgi:CRISPR-associated endonuclease Csn1
MQVTADEVVALGLDLGSNSVGWALVAENKTGTARILRAGVRVFDAGVEGDIESGRDESRNAKRRTARQQRKQLDRRNRRHVKVILLLQRHGLMPDGELAIDAERDRILKQLDRALFEKYRGFAAVDETLRPRIAQLPYFLRARALDYALEPLELGRVLYHLAQRRGFQSNRKSAPKDEDEGVVKADIAKLTAAMKDSGARTLGEYFSKLDPHEHRIRARWTSREMYRSEFERIWEAQAAHHPGILTTELKVALCDAMFFQRKLKSQKHLVGKCELEDQRKRAPLALLESQRVRYLQKVNDLRIVEDGTERPLTDEQRRLLIDALESQDEMKFTSMRTKFLKLGKSTTFNLERGGEEKIYGNRTAAKLKRVMGETWDSLSESERAQIVEDVLSIENEDALKKRGMSRWGLTEEDAIQFSGIRPEPGYGRFSRQALRKLIPLMQIGTPLQTAIKEIYGPARLQRPIVNLLPIVQESGLEIRNPAVQRTLTETRRVVNALLEGPLKSYGKPYFIRIELARDLKRPRKERENMWKRNRQREKIRNRALAEVKNKTGNEHPSRGDIERWLLAEECNWECPYTGQRISAGNLFGDSSQFDIEHIIPWSRCFEDSFANKTLCYHEENRNRKGKGTPWEVYGDTPEWDTIIARVKAFKSDFRDEKLRRFQLRELSSFDDFSARQLNDTRYATRLAADYLGLLYGGQIDSDGTRRIQAGRGQVTAALRNAWGLNGVLSEGPRKSRDDHRHHAIDAIAVALTNAKTVHMLSKSAQSAGPEHGRRRWWKHVPLPWDGFLNDVQSAIDGITVSHRVSRKVAGALHEETLYSRPRTDEDGKPCVHVRKKIEALSPNDVDNIVDAAVCACVKTKLEELGTNEPQKAFKTREDHPCLVTHDGRLIPIHKVRIRKREKTFEVGREARVRNVVPASNHHTEIIETTDKRGNVRWEDIIVDQYTALQRLRNGEPIIQRDHGERNRFVMSLAGGEIIEMDGEVGTRVLYAVRGVSKDIVTFVQLCDSRLKKDIIASKQWGSLRLNGLRQRNCRKVLVTHLGEVRNAND